MIDLHNGTSFDYLMALLRILQKIEDYELSDSVIISGSFYFLSKSSAERWGFTIGKTSFAEKLNISLNYLDMVWTYSLTRGTLTFPNLGNINTVSITGKELVKKKQQIVNLANRLKLK